MGNGVKKRTQSRNCQLKVGGKRLCQLNSCYYSNEIDSGRRGLHKKEIDGQRNAVIQLNARSREKRQGV
jgi:hypothetical protein